MGFYSAFTVLILLALLFMFWPWLRRSGSKTADIDNRESVNIRLYRDHLSELENTLSQGVIDQSQFATLKAELDSNLLEDSQEADSSPSTKLNIPTIWLLGAAAIIVPLATLVLYQWLGNSSGWALKQLLEQQAQLEQEYRQSGSAELEKQLQQHSRKLLSGLLDHVDQHPDDLQSQVLLARTAMEVNQYDLAITYYQRILEQESEAAQMMAELAQAIFLKANNQAVPVVGMLAEQAIQRQPDNAMALGLLGIYHYQQGEYAKAIPVWQRAVAIYPPGSANGQALSNGITQAQAKLAASGEDLAGSDAAGGNATQVKVAVSLAPEVPVSPGDTVFIYARAWQGPKMPVAITRIKASQLPITVALNESMAMAPGMTLATVDQVELVARLSPSGNAIAQAGDWQASLGPVQPSSSTSVYPLVISQPVSIQ